MAGEIYTRLFCFMKENKTIFANFAESIFFSPEVFSRSSEKRGVTTFISETDKLQKIDKKKLSRLFQTYLSILSHCDAKVFCNIILRCANFVPLFSFAQSLRE